MLFLLLSLAFCHLVLSEDYCVPPEFKNGFIQSQGDSQAWSGHFECNPGYLMFGRKILKCRDGIWSSKPPICTAVGKCDANHLPSIQNGKKIKLKDFRGTIFRYECEHGYRLYGQRQVHCTQDGWNIQEAPICASLDCDGSLVERVEQGQSKKLSKGSVYRYRCSSGSVLVGSPLVYCNNGKWNDTAPRCTVGPERVRISSEDLFNRGEPANIRCTTTESNPPAEIIWEISDKDGNDLTNQMEIVASKIEYKLNGWTSESSLKIPEHLTWKINLFKVKCTGFNEEGRNSVDTFKEIDMFYAPSSVSIHGQGEVLEGSRLNLECVTGPSHPPASIIWKIYKGDEIKIERGESIVDDVSDTDGEGGEVTSSLLTLDIDVDASDDHLITVKCVAEHPLLQQPLTDSQQVTILCPPGQPQIYNTNKFVKKKLRHRGEPGHLVHGDKEHLVQGENNYLVQGENEHLVYSKNEQPVYGGNEQLVYGEPEQLVCRSRAGNPPARLHWFRGQQMLHSKYRIEGDNVISEITFVPTFDLEEFTCEAYNEAVNLPVKQTVQFNVVFPTTSTTTTSTTTSSTTTTTTTTSTTTTSTTTKRRRISTPKPTTTFIHQIAFEEKLDDVIVDTYDYQYDYSHFDYVNEKMNESFIKTVLDVGEEYYYEAQDYSIDDNESLLGQNIDIQMNSDNLDNDDLPTEYTHTSNNIDYSEVNNYDQHTHDISSIQHQVIDVNMNKDMEDGGTQSEVFTNKYLNEKKEALSNTDGKKQKKDNHQENETFAKGLKSVKDGRGVLNNGLTIIPSYLVFAIMLLPAMHHLFNHS